MTNGINGYVFLDETTDFDGDIEAEVVVLEGRVRGEVHARRGLHLKQGAYIEGEIHTENFTAEKGASCKGELYVNTKKQRENSNAAPGTGPEVDVAPTGTQNENGSLF
ncbi:polymer-forming cytoskeletal protein [Halalkalibaculum sp. DA3122]|uniref:bactofilin family protein n=1 Tax=Halalkalibaculum sp. DA3122 TaxID=3373607 RepID=UPI003754C822